MAQKRFNMEGGFITNGDSQVEGNLSVTGSPTLIDHVTTKVYVDTAIAGVAGNNQGISGNGDLFMSGHIIPTIDSDGTTGYDLGSPAMKWRDLYLSQGSLYIDGQKVIESTGGTIVVQADPNQSLTTKVSGTGVLTLDSDTTVNIAGTLQMATGMKITDQGGNAVVFGDKVDLDNNQIINVGTPTAAGHVTTKGYVDQEISNVINGAPGALDTLNELANALGDDANFAGTITNELALKATIAYVDAQISGVNAGSTGATGATGATGPQGEVGPAGSGSTGPQGLQGIQGIQGIQGETGADSVVAGPQGPAGAQGPAGGSGSDGAAGANGADGVAGAAGADGADGVDGADGATGATGAQGVQGTSIVGETGPTGATGPAGADGADGSTYSDTDVSTYLSGNLNTTIVPDTDATYDIGSAFYKIRDLYLSNNSLHIGDGTLSNDGSNNLLFNGADVMDYANVKNKPTTLAGYGIIDGPVAGPQGNAGAAGSQGIQGNTGTAGATGPAGTAGAQGIQGIQGAAGLGINFLGQVATTGDLPTGSNTQGDAYIVQADDSLHVWDGTSAWVSGGSIQGPQGIQGVQGTAGADGAGGSGAAPVRVNFIATAGQTTKTGLTYTVGNIDCYVNGSKMMLGTDFTATDSVSVTFASALEIDDEVQLIMGTSASAAGGGSSVTAYADLAAIPTSGNTEGDMAFASDTKALYVWDGTEWDRIFSGSNESPDWTTAPSDTLSLEIDGTPTIKTVAATDPDGFPIVYSYDTNPPNQTIATISNTGGAFTFTPSVSQVDEGEFTMRYKAFDGVRTLSKSTIVSLMFGPGATFNALFINTTSGTIYEVVGGADEANATDLQTAITAAQPGDIIYLKPAASGEGHFKYIGDTGGGHNLWEDKAFSFVGGGVDPTKTFIWHNHNGTTTNRDYPIFANSINATIAATLPDTGSYQQTAFNLTYHRHQSTGTNYSNALTGSSSYGGGMMLNCIIDLNGGGFSWGYDNTSSLLHRRTFKNCTFLNGSNVGSYSGNSGSVRVIDCAFSGGISTSVMTSVGTNVANVNVNGWKYDTRAIDLYAHYAFTAAGHMKNLSTRTSVNTLFNTWNEPDA